MPKTKGSISARQLMLLKLSGITGTVFLGAVNLITTLGGRRAAWQCLGEACSAS